MSTIFDAATADEFSVLSAFIKGMVVKEQENADAAEADALADAGERYVPTTRAARDWKSITGYVQVGSTTIETRVEPYWVDRPVGSDAAVYAIDRSALTVWRQTSPVAWLNDRTGQFVTLPNPEWTVVTAPAGRSFIDPAKGRVLIPAPVWYDSTTRAVTVLGPTDGEQFTSSGTTSRPTRPEGLSDLIASPQEYVTARITLAAGGLTAEARASLESAIASFSAVAPWEDVRQPLYAIDNTGRLVLDPLTGLPLTNPLRVVDVPFRGELNQYYRRLVRDYGIDPFDARSAEQFQVIQWPTTTTLSSDDARRFVSTHAECARVFRAAFYNRAMEDEPLYFPYCRTFIAWMAMNQTISERMKGLSDVDRLGDSEITNLLYSFGIYQFDDMPVTYRRRLAKNLELLLSAKGTTQAFRDILSIFGMGRDVRIWKHYLVRFFPFHNYSITIPRFLTPGESLTVRVVNGGSDVLGVGSSHDEIIASVRSQLVDRGDFSDVKVKGLTLTFISARRSNDQVASPSGAEIMLGDVTLMQAAAVEGSHAFNLPEVGFQQADIDDMAGESTVAQMDTSYLADFDEFVSRDALWETTRADARKQAFSVMQTKFFSMSAALDTVQNGLQLSFLWGALKDAQLKGRGAELSMHSAGAIQGVGNLTLFEAFVAVLTLTLWRFGVDDIIPHGESGVSTILQARTDGSAFPNEGTLLPYSTALARVADATTFSPSVVGDIAQSNATASSRVQASISALTSSPNDQFAFDPITGNESTRALPHAQALDRLWDYKFISAVQTAAFGGSSTYIEWMDRNNSELAAWMRAQDAAKTHTDGIIALTNIMEEALGSDGLNLFSAFGTSDVILTYVERLIRFFKAYTTDLRDLSVYMLIDRPSTERVRLMNLLAGVTVEFDRFDGLTMQETAKWIAGLLEGDAIALEDTLLAGFSGMTKQDIADLIDSSSVSTSNLLVNPAAVMRDQIVITSTHGRRDALTVQTRTEPLTVVGESFTTTARLKTQGLANRVTIRSI